MPTKAPVSSQPRSPMNQPAARPKTALARWWPALVIPVVAAAALLIYPYLYPTKSPTPVGTGAVTIVASHANAFGTLMNANTATNRVATGTGLAVGSVVPSAAKDSATQIAPSPTTDTTYRYPIYAYDGTITIPSNDVLKREKSLAGLPGINNLSVPLLNIGSFAGLHADQATWSQQTSDGYTITVVANEGTVSIYRTNNATVISPLMGGAAGTTSSGSAATTTTSDTPTSASSAPNINIGTSTTNTDQVNPVTDALKISDADAIQAAGRFLRLHGIPLAGYGAPIVLSSGYAMDTMVKSVYIPVPYLSAVTVTYPWVVNSLPVYDEGGNVFGLQVTVDAATKTVQSVHNLMTRNFTASTYSVTHSVTAVQDYLKRGGWMSSAVDSATQTVMIQTEAPKSVYMFSQYQLNSSGDELLVPALLFALGTADQKTTGRPAVVVPVLDDLLKAPTTPDVLLKGGEVIAPAVGTTTTP